MSSRVRRCTCLLVLAFAFAVVAPLARADATSGASVAIGAGLRGPSGLTASVYAQGLKHASAMATDAQGRVWIATAAATDKGKDDRSGRLPVLITARWWNGDAQKTDRAIYQVRWKTAGRLFRGRTVSLEGASLAERGGTPARLDALWAKEKPAP